MNDSSCLPAVTMAVISYNSAASIAYAAESALQQDYKGPLTIVFSDDASTDDTMSIIREIVAAYKGPHRVIVHQNDKNLYIFRNMHKALSLAPSDFQCKLDADDYAAPDRVSRLVDAFLSHPGATLCMAELKKNQVNSFAELPNFHEVEYQGSGEVFVLDGRDVASIPLGSVIMWRRDIFERFAPYLLKADYRGYADDYLLGMLARMYGDILMLRRELLCYILHAGNQSYISRRVRYSSLRAFNESEDKLLALSRRNYPWQKWACDWMREYLDTHDDIEPQRRQIAEHCLRGMLNWIQVWRMRLEYGSRSFPARFVYWLRHPGDSPSYLLPRVLRYAGGRFVRRMKVRRQR